MASELRFILLGKTGVGKSATGNFILKKKVFKSKQGFNAVTKTTSSHESILDFAKTRITVVDTPGLFDNETPMLETITAIQNSLDFAKQGPNAFLLVIKPGRLTDEEEQTVGLLRMTFGNEFLKYTIVIFTHEDHIDGPFRNQIEKNRILKDLLHDCSERYITLNTSERNDAVINRKLEQLLRFANNVSDNGKKIYAENINIYRNAVLKYVKEYTGIRLTGEQIKLILQQQEEERFLIFRKQEEERLLILNQEKKEKLRQKRRKGFKIGAGLASLASVGAAGAAVAVVVAGVAGVAGTVALCVTGPIAVFGIIAGVVIHFV